MNNFTNQTDTLIRRVKQSTLTLIDELSPLGEIVEYKQDEIILKIGDENDSIYFIVQGMLRIVIENETVATLENQGDIIGEMSIVSDGPCSADVIAMTASKLLKLSTKKLKEQSENYELILYKIFCNALAVKLDSTNVKATQFERLNRSLEDEVSKRIAELQEKNSMIQMSHKKLENNYQENIQLIGKIASLNNDYIIPTLKDLDENPIPKEKIEKNLNFTKNILLSLHKLKNDQEQLKKQKVMVVENNAKLRNIIKIALGGTGIIADVFSKIEEAREQLVNNHYDIVFLSLEMLELTEKISNKDKIKFVLFTEKESKELMQKIHGKDFLTNIIVIKQDDRAFNIKSISTTISKMTSGDIFGLNKYLNWGAEITQFKINDSKKRQELNEKILNQIEQLGIRSSLRSRCQIVIEEMLMNAIYDAPVDKMGQPLHNHKSRTEHIILSEDQSAKLSFATDGLFLGISVIDPFGSFKKEILFKYLANNYFDQDSNYNENNNKGGAGKGLYMITENSDMVIYNISPGQQTEIIALFDLDPSKDKKATSLHYFET
jgi:CRP-like cAMP-binding protein/CheY-like chemotaxis protein